MDIVLSANAPGVPEAFRRHVDSRHDISLGLAPARRRSDRAECFGRQHRSCPGPEILRGDITACHFLQVTVYILGLHDLLSAFVIEILEELFAAQLLTPL